MTFDDGILKIYSVENMAAKGEKPKYGLKLKSQHFYGYETVGITRHYAAMQVNSKISSLVHIWQDREITGENICILEDGKQYKCSLVQHAEEDGLGISKITLERIDEEYVIIEDIQS